jgi:hypothetical protein
MKVRPRIINGNIVRKIVRRILGIDCPRLKNAPVFSIFVRVK